MDYNEDPIDACRRELLEETGLAVKTIELLSVRGHPLRDSRGHIISIFYRVETEGVM